MQTQHQTHTSASRDIFLQGNIKRTRPSSNTTHGPRSFKSHTPRTHAHPHAPTMAASKTPPPMSVTPATPPASPSPPTSPPRPSKMKKRGSLFGLKKAAAANNADGAGDSPASDSSSYSQARRGSEGSVSSDGSTRRRRGAAGAGDAHLPASPPLPASSGTAKFTFPTSASQQAAAAFGSGHAPAATSTATAPVPRHSHNTLPRSRRESLDSPGAAMGRLGAPFAGDEATAFLASSSQHGARPRSGSEPLTASGHARVRSHFSIPDVMITSCEEEGEETHFEVKLQDEKRRTRLGMAMGGIADEDINPAHGGGIAAGGGGSGSGGLAAARSLGNIIKPFLGFEAGGSESPTQSSMPTTSVVGGGSAAFPTAGGSYTHAAIPNSAVAVVPQPQPTTAKRTRKASLPMLFGRGKAKSSSGQGGNDNANNPQPPPSPTHSASPSSPYSQRGGFDSSGSLPWSSSRDSLPSSGSGAGGPDGDGEIDDGEEDVDLTTPPDTPGGGANASNNSKSAFGGVAIGVGEGGTLASQAAALPSLRRPSTQPPTAPSTRPPLPPPQLTKKELRRQREREQLTRKQREKEEVALMRELARVDKMVRAHDAKAEKVRAKEEKLSKKKRNGSVDSSEGGASASAAVTAASGKFPKALRRMTMFGGGGGASAARGNASAAAATANASGAGAGAGSNGLSRKVSTSRRVGGNSGGVTSGPHARTAGAPPPLRRPHRPPPLHSGNDVGGHAVSFRAHAQPLRSAPLPNITTAGQPKDSEESERLSFSPQEWADLPDFLQQDRGGAAAATAARARGFPDLSFDDDDDGGGENANAGAGFAADAVNAKRPPPPPASHAPLARRRSKRTTASANRGSMAFLPQQQQRQLHRSSTASSGASSSNDSRRNSAALAAGVSRRRSRLLGHKESSRGGAGEEDGWEEARDEDAAADTHITAGVVLADADADSRCATPLASDLNRRTASPTFYPNAPMNVGQVVNGTTSFRPLPSSSGVGNSSSAAPQSPSIVAAFMVPNT